MSNTPSLIDYMPNAKGGESMISKEMVLNMVIITTTIHYIIIEI